MMCQITGSIHFAAATPRVNSTFFVQNYWSHTETKVAGMNWLCGLSVSVKRLDLNRERLQPKEIAVC